MSELIELNNNFNNFLVESIEGTNLVVVDEEKLIDANKMLNSWLDGDFRVLSEIQYECFEIMSYEDDKIYIIESL